MKKIDISFDSLPGSALSISTLNICLKCAFDFFTRQLDLSPRTAYSELKNHVPEETDFSGATTARPHFFDKEGLTHCPFCTGSRQWFAQFKAIRVDAYAEFEKERKKLWTALRKQPARFTLWNSARTGMQIFSDWLDRINRRIDFESDHWLIDTAIEQIKRACPSTKWDEVLQAGVSRVQLSRHQAEAWSYEGGRLFVSTTVYGDVLIIQHLLSRSHHHGGRTFEGRLTLQELISRLRRTGYLEARGIDLREAYEAFEQAVSAIVASGPEAVYYAVDRSDYLEKLKSVYEKKRRK